MRSLDRSAQALSDRESHPSVFAGDDRAAAQQHYARDAGETRVLDDFRDQVGEHAAVRSGAAQGPH